MSSLQQMMMKGKHPSPITMPTNTDELGLPIPQPPISPQNIPRSPTDTMMSPCSKQLTRNGKGAFRRSANLSEGVKYSLNLAVSRRDIPCEEPIILGSSSANRKQIIELLEWPYTQMSPDIDGKF